MFCRERKKYKMVKIHVLNIIFLVFITCANATSKDDFETIQRNTYATFALEYFKYKKIQNAVMLLCWPIIDQFNLVTMFAKNYMRISLLGKKFRNQKTLDKIFRVYSTKMGAIYDSCCQDSHTPYMQKNKFFNASYVWIILDCGHFDRSLEYIKTLQLNVITDLILTNHNSQTNDLKLFDIYHTGWDRGGLFNVSYVGLWQHPESRLSEYKSNWTDFFIPVQALRRSDLQGLTIGVVTLTENNFKGLDTHQYLMDDLRPYEDTIFKMNYQLIRILRTMNNFTIKIVLANNWSDKNSKGSYQSGNLLGILHDKKADIMAGAMRMSLDTLKVTDIIYFTYPYRSGFIFRYTGDFGDIRMNFNSPFHKYVWYCFGTIIVLMSATMWFILSFENKYVNKSSRRVRWNWSDAILSCIGACCQMGSELNPSTSASRIVYFIFLCSTLIMYNFYTSSIVSSLLSFRKEKFTLVDLANSPLRCGSMESGNFRNSLFDFPEYPDMPYFNSKKLTEDFYYTFIQGLDMVKRGGFAYHAEFISMYHLIEDKFEPSEICELAEIDTIPYSKSAIMGQKNSPYTEMFKAGFSKAAETGQLNRALLKWAPRKPICQAGKSFAMVGLHQIMSSYKIMYVGIGLSLVLFILELATLKFFDRENHQSRNVKRKINP